MKNTTKIRLLVVMSYALIVVIVFGRSLLAGPDQLIFGDDIHRSYNFFRQFFGHALRAGSFPWWNPYLFSGEPFIANPSVSFWYPPNWLFAVLPLSTAYSWIIAFHIFLAMAGTYWFARKFLPTVSAWTSGVVFGLSGFFSARIFAGHSDILTSAPYVPIVFGLFWQAMEKRTARAVVLAAGALALQIYAGYQSVAFFTLEAVGIACLFWVIKTKSVKPAVTVVAAVALGLGLASLQLLPGQEFFLRSIRTFPLPYSWAVAGALQAEHLSMFINPFSLGDQYTFRGFPSYGEFAAYIGKVPLILALGAVVASVGMVLRRKKTQVFLVTVLTCISVFSFWVALAWNAPVDLQYILWNVVPVYRYLRVPARHLILFVFAASMLSGFGMSLIRKKSLRYALLLLTLVDLLPFARHMIVLRESPETRHDAKLVNILTAEPELVRYLPNFSVATAPRDSLDFDAAMSYRIYSVSGYDPSILRNYYEFIAAVNQVQGIDIQQNDVQIPPMMMNTPYTDIMNIKYLLVNSWIDLKSEAPDQFRLITRDENLQYSLYENTSVMSRFFAVPDLHVLPDRESVARAIRDRTYDPRMNVLTYEAVVRGKSLIPDCGGRQIGEITVDSYSLNRTEITTNTVCNSFLTSSEVMYPGWDAWIDGRKTEIFEGNLAFRTLYLPKGTHTVVLRYTPRIFFFGGFVSILTAVCCIGLWNVKKGSK
jgi:hypothetical protein